MTDNVVPIIEYEPGWQRGNFTGLVRYNSKKRSTMTYYVNGVVCRVDGENMYPRLYLEKKTNLRFDFLHREISNKIKYPCPATKKQVDKYLLNNFINKGFEISTHKFEDWYVYCLSNNPAYKKDNPVVEHVMGEFYIYR